MFVTIVMSGEKKKKKKKAYVKVIGNHLQFAMLELQQKKKVLKPLYAKANGYKRVKLVVNLLFHTSTTCLLG